ncbi:MAG: IS66 family transposase, partial [Desulfobacterales bacterium]|nr:IS66 family transposase [Desulfobacterales bacterium]
MFFGKKSEKSKDVLKNDDQDKKSPSTNNPPEKDPPKKKEKRKGHGRNGADSYTGADKSFVPHPDLVPG